MIECLFEAVDQHSVSFYSYNEKGKTNSVILATNSLKTVKKVGR